jgi:hypothetical protein
MHLSFLNACWSLIGPLTKAPAGCLCEYVQIVRDELESAVSMKVFLLEPRRYLLRRRVNDPSKSAQKHTLWKDYSGVFRSIQECSGVFREVLPSRSMNPELSLKPGGELELLLLQIVFPGVSTKRFGARLTCEFQCNGRCFQSQSPKAHLILCGKCGQTGGLACRFRIVEVEILLGCDMWEVGLVKAS